MWTIFSIQNTFVGSAVCNLYGVKTQLLFWDSCYPWHKFRQKNHEVLEVNEHVFVRDFAHPFERKLRISQYTLIRWPISSALLSLCCGWAPWTSARSTWTLDRCGEGWGLLVGQTMANHGANPGKWWQMWKAGHSANCWSWPFSVLETSHVCFPSSVSEEGPLKSPQQ